MSGLYLLNGTDVEIVNKLEQVTLTDLARASGFRVEIAGSDAFEISFKSSRLHIHPTPSDVCSRVCSLALTQNLFASGVREIRIDTFVAPYLERALEHAANSLPNQDSSVYVCFQAEACKYAESAAIIRTMLAMAGTQKQQLHVHVTVAVRHWPCVCPHSATECHQFQPKLWALAMRDFYAACKNPEYAVIHEFVGTPHGSVADQAAKDEMAFSTECHALVPAANWSTIGPHRIAFLAGMPYIRLRQHTSTWSAAQWRVGRVLQARIVSPDTKQPYFRTLVPICGTIALSQFEELRCGDDAILLASKLLENRAWSECVTLCAKESSRTFDISSRLRVSGLCVELENASADNMRRILQFLHTNRKSLHTLDLSVSSSTRLTSEAITDLVTKYLALASDVHHVIVSGSDSKKTTPLANAIGRSLTHATLRELTLPVAANGLATLFSRPVSALPALQHLNLVLDGDLRGSNIEQLFPDPVRVPSVRRLAGVSLALTHPDQQVAVALLVRKLALGLPCLRSLEVRTRYGGGGGGGGASTKDDYAIATAISESAPNLQCIERLVLDTPISPALLLNLFHASAAAIRLRTLCVNIHGAQAAGAKAHELLRALAKCSGTLRELKIVGDFIDECDNPSLMRQTIGSLRLSTLDLSECKLGAELAALALKHGPPNVSHCACVCGCLMPVAGVRRGRGAVDARKHKQTRPADGVHATAGSVPEGQHDRQSRESRRGFR
jgi:hypothetical protein